MNKSHRKYLHFCVKGKCYQFKAMCFGPIQAPRVFTKIVTVVAAFLRIHNICLSTYLDNWCIANSEIMGALSDRDMTLDILLKLWFIINLKKSSLIPSPTIIYLGSLFKLISGLVFPHDRKDREVRKCNSDFDHTRKFSFSIPSCSWTHGIMYRNSPIRPVTHTSNSTSFALFLETSFKGHVNQNPCKKTFYRASEVVVSVSKYAKGQIPSTMVYDSNHNHRFFQDRLRMSFRGSENFSGDMVKGRIQTTHKYFGTGCCSSNSVSFPIIFRKQEFSGQIRQQHCSPNS